MIMETISCGYPIVPSGLGVSPISPPSTPTGTDTYAPQLYAQTEYVQPGFASSPHSYSKYDEDANNNNHIYSSDALNNNNHNSPATSRSVSSSSDHDSLLSDFSCMSIAESDERFSDPSFIPGSPDYLGQMSPPSHPAAGRTKPKKSSRSKAKVSSSSSVSSPDDSSDKRKDSFVYDVRLPDEQILLFVPDLVSFLPFRSRVHRRFLSPLRSAVGEVVSLSRSSIAFRFDEEIAFGREYLCTMKRFLGV